MVFLLFSICPAADTGSGANRRHVLAIPNAKTAEVGSTALTTIGT